MEILLNSGLGILGFLMFTIYKSKDYIYAKEFNFVIFLQENIKGWVWSLLVILLLSFIIFLEPTTKDIIKSIFGIDLTASPLGFFIFGAGINVLTKKSSSRARAAKTRYRENKKVN